MEAYCVRCKQKREIAEAEPTFTSSGVPATKGKCPVCGTKLYRMGRTPEHEGLEPPEAPKGVKRRAKQIRRKGKLVIVESPAKARTVGRILGEGFAVKASVGHVRDLLRSRLSVDVEHDFEPSYRVPNEKREVVKALKAEAAKAEEVYLATDPDREGEAIAWHLMESADIESERAKRVVFHEITTPAVKEAFEHPRRLDMDLVNAQQARRILDRLVGYNLSPLLWRKVRGRLSAGRVQSVALRMLVEREREIRNFVPQEYWSLDGEFQHPEKPPSFRAKLMQVDGRKAELPDEGTVQSLLADLSDGSFAVSEVRRGRRIRKPAAPFTTSTMQQTASRRFSFTARRTMAIAQQLYEGVDLGEDGSPTGLITYMRTDSTQVSEQALVEVREHIGEQFGPEFLPARAVRYAARARGAQEAHEAIRPTSVGRTPESLKEYLNKDQYRLYDLIWRRFVASQMNPAVYDTMVLEVEGRGAQHSYMFRASTSALRFPGYLEVYQESKLDENGAGNRKDEPIQLPNLEKGDRLDLVELHPEQHFTQPPPRYTDASLIRAMEEHGIGRPSTYAPTISTLRQRGYVKRQDRRLVPTEVGELVTDLLMEHFPNIVDLGFTAEMEAELDEIASGERHWVDVVRTFYGPFAEQLAKAAEEMPEMRAEPEEIGRSCPECGSPLVLRQGRYGPFIGCSDFPACRYTEPILDKIGVACPLDGGDLVRRRTRRGRIFYGCANYPECEFTSWKRPLPTACPQCGGLLVVENKSHAACIKCGHVLDLSGIEGEPADLA